MPYKFDTNKLKISKDDDKRRKLTEFQKEQIKQNLEGLSQRKLAAKYSVSKTTIQFILNPKSKELSLERRQERGGSMQYYDKEKHRESMKRYRHGKKELFDKGKLEDSDNVK
jgi:transposase